MTEQRKLYCHGDALLDHRFHQVGDRLLLSNKASASPRYEATILEWSPTGKHVKLRYAPGNERWVDCWDYDPVVIEVLPPAPSTGIVSDESAMPLLDEVFDFLLSAHMTSERFMVASGVRPSTRDFGTSCIFLNQLGSDRNPIPGRQYRLVLLEDFN